MTYLKPCPFCGKNAKVQNKTLLHISKRCIIGDIELHCNSAEEAAEIWNDRYETENRYNTPCRNCAGVGEVDVEDEYGEPAGIPCPCCDGSGLEKNNTCYDY